MMQLKVQVVRLKNESYDGLSFLSNDDCCLKFYGGDEHDDDDDEGDGESSGQLNSEECHWLILKLEIVAVALKFNHNH